MGVGGGGVDVAVDGVSGVSVLCLCVGVFIST